MEKVLEVNNLSKNYGGLEAVRNVSFSVNRGEVYGLLGPNGSGKTTTLAVILGVLNANGGDFKWFGNTLQKEARQKIGSLIETPNFYPYLTLFENLLIAAKIKNASEESINYALGVANLLKRKHTNFGTLSLGMKQRMAIASVLIGDPEVLVLDEPTNGLDPEGFAEVRSIIQSQAAKGKTIILASHILDEVEKVCSHVAILKSGDLIANGRVGELLTTEDLVFIQSTNQDELFSALQMAEMVSRVTKVEDDLSVVLKKPFSASELNKFCFEKGFVLSKIMLRKQSLEAQFLELVK
ncbi:MAG: ABC transporter ATP-binding protein [Bacteroidetes bacterium GWF2_33_16]|nr:MAG: ABC transporter ATP-binding protein [Bacteroidetes bacterium GWE2_32_14]OFY05279.1 MAG: ABC transporter ATP-binding protein [Bacteroidetes bacterium GWF2_33_16]